MSDRLTKANELKEYVSKVNDHTFIVPSQTRDKKSHIVTSEVLVKMVPVPDKLLRRAFYLKKEVKYYCYGENLINKLIDADFITLLDQLSKYIDDCPPELKYTCTCENHKYTGKDCKHILAVINAICEGMI